MIRSLAFVTLISTLSASSAQASDWRYVSSIGYKPDRSNYFIDVDSLTVDATGLAHAWFWRFSESPASTPDRSARLLYEYDCAGERYRVISSLIEPWHGGVVSSDDDNAPFAHVPPNTANYTFIRLVCLKMINRLPAAVRDPKAASAAIFSKPK